MASGWWSDLPRAEELVSGWAGSAIQVPKSQGQFSVAPQRSASWKISFSFWEAYITSSIISWSFGNINDLPLHLSFLRWPRKCHSGNVLDCIFVSKSHCQQPVTNLEVSAKVQILRFPASSFSFNHIRNCTFCVHIAYSNEIFLFLPVIWKSLFCCFCWYF